MHLAFCIFNLALFRLPFPSLHFAFCIVPFLGEALPPRPCVKLFDSQPHFTRILMMLSREYVGYLAREVAKKLIAGEFIETSDPAGLTARVHAAMVEELALEDRINDEVRAILEQYSDEMRKSGASYQEMFKKVKNELVRKYKAVL